MWLVNRILIIIQVHIIYDIYNLFLIDIYYTCLQEGLDVCYHTVGISADSTSDGKVNYKIAHALIEDSESTLTAFYVFYVQQMFLLCIYLLVYFFIPVTKL